MKKISVLLFFLCYYGLFSDDVLFQINPEYSQLKEFDSYGVNLSINSYFTGGKLGDGAIDLTMFKIGVQRKYNLNFFSFKLVDLKIHILPSRLDMTRLMYDKRNIVKDTTVPLGMIHLTLVNIYRSGLYDHDDIWFGLGFGYFGIVSKYKSVYFKMLPELHLNVSSSKPGYKTHPGLGVYANKSVTGLETNFNLDMSLYTLAHIDFKLFGEAAALFGTEHQTFSTKYGGQITLRAILPEHIFAKGIDLELSYSKEHIFIRDYKNVNSMFKAAFVYNIGMF